MEMKNKNQAIAIFLSVTFSVFVVGLVVYGATTIGNNITTGGALRADTASTSNDFWLGNETADDDDFLYMDASSSEYMQWDDSADQFVFSNGVILPSATTTDSMYIGGIASTTGDLYIGMRTAAGDDYLYFDANENKESLMWDDTPGQFALSDDLKVTGVATGTVALWAGSGGIPTQVDLTGGDLYVQGDAEIDGSLYADSATTTDTFSIGGGIAIREFNWGTCSFANRASINASTTAYIECLDADEVASGDNIYVMATSSFDTNFIIQAASSTASDIISIRVLNTGMNTGHAEDTTLDGTTLNWQSIR